MDLDTATLVKFAIRAGLALGVFLLGRWLAYRARGSLRPILGKTTLPPSMTRLILLAAYYGILLLTLIVSLALLGFPIEVLLTASLIIVVILGIALQQSIANLAAAIVFMLFQPFRVGELVEANGVMGTVKELQFFSTVLVTGDNREVTIPNAEIQGHNLTNYTRLGCLRVDFVFSVSYADNLDRVKEVLHEVLAGDARILPEPAPLIFVQKLNDSSVDIAVRPWVKVDDYWALQWDLPERVKRSFDAEGITIPFPQRDVHLRPNGVTLQA